MTEIRLDPISTLMPLGSRVVAPTTEFASYLDEAWNRSTTTANTANDRAGRHSPASAETSRDVAAPVERRKGDGKDTPEDPCGEAGVGVAPASQDQTSPSESNTATVEASADEATAATAPKDDAGQETQSTENAAGGTQEAEASQSDAAASEEVASPANVMTNANPDTALLDVPAEQQSAVEGETPASHELAEALEDGVAETVPAAAKSDMPAVGEASSETPSSEDKTGNEGDNAGNRESNAEGEKPAGLQEAAERNDNAGDGVGVGGGEPDQAIQPKESDELVESRSRHGRPATAKDAGTTREPQATDRSQEQAFDATVQAPGATGTSDTSPSATAAVAAVAVPAAPAATVETSQQTASATGTPSVEPVEGVATGATRTTRGEPGARATSTTPGAPDADQAGAVDRARFVQRVAQAFQATGDRGGTIRMRLSPPELGSLRVEITVKQGVMNARMETETDTARQLVLENLPALRERLAEQGVKVEQFQVDVSGRETGGQTSQFEDRSYSDRSDAEPRRHSTSRGTSTQDAESQGDRRARRVGEISRLDVLV